MNPSIDHAVKRRPFIWTFLGLFTLCAALQAQEDTAPFVDSLVHGDVSLSLRIRYEQAAVTSQETSDALTLRTRLGYGTKPYHGFNAYVEFEDISTLNDVDDYNPAGTNPDSQNKALIPELEATELNKAFLAYATEGQAFAARVGRQRILSGDCRYIPMNTYGVTRNFVWRQNEQTMDAVTFRWKLLKDLDMFYGYVDNIYRPFGQEQGTKPAGERMNAAEIRSDSHLVNLRYSPLKQLGITCFAYLLELGDGAFAAANASDTIGLDVAGDFGLGEDWTLHYAADYARQVDNSATTADADFDAGYYKGAASGATDKLKLGFVYEVLESDDGLPFRSPLATPHKLNGWADVFMITPADGLTDFSGFLRYKLFPTMTGIVKYHAFRSERGNDPYGTEWDILVQKQIGKHLSLTAKYANYAADSRADNPVGDDVERIWLLADAAL